MVALALPTLSLSETERETLERLVAMAGKDSWHLQTSDNYYTGLSVAWNLGIAVPPSLAAVKTVTGWPRIVVDALEERLDIDVIRCPGNPGLDDAVAEIWADNDLADESQLAHLDALVYGRSYLVAGVDEAGTPRLTVESPQYMTLDWDVGTRRVKAALRLIGQGTSRSATLYLPDQTVYLDGSGTGWTVTDRRPHQLGVVPVVRMANRQRTADRHGSSEITAEVRALTDAACRTLLGAELAREFFAAPQRYILGASESAFQNPDGSPRNAWETYIGRYLALERDEDGQVPQVGQFAAHDPSVFAKYVDMYARLMSGLTGTPPHMLGYTTDNPASADAIRSSEGRLIKQAERHQRVFSGPWSRGMQMCLRLSGYAKAAPLEVSWRDAATPTVAAQADATTKLVAAGVLPGDSEVTWERAGISRQQRERLVRDRKRSAGRLALDQIAAGLAERTPGRGTPSSADV